MLFNINMGHTLLGADIGTRGLNGSKEEVMTRQYGKALGEELKRRGHKINYSKCDYANSLTESLNYQVSQCNSVNADLNICLHFNTTVGGYGTEIFTYQGKYSIEGEMVLQEMKKLGFKNRGIKDQGLALTRNTKAKTIYIEVCFIDSPHDMALLNKYGPEGVAVCSE